MQKLSDQKIELINSLLKEGIPLPEEYKSLLFESKSEYELTYAGKEREVDILADTMLVPLQPVKTFMQGESNTDWMNMLIFGDNLQVLKTLLQMKQEGKLKNSDGSPGIRLIYIDPPFATKQEFRGSQDQKAYQDKIAGSEFIEFLRKRLVFLRELLSDDGSLYVHLDWKKGHYIKLILDEIFHEENFLNDIVWQSTTAAKFQTIGFPRTFSNIYIYHKSENYNFNKQFTDFDDDYINSFYKNVDEETGRRYMSSDLTQRGSGPARVFGDRGEIAPPEGKHWIWSQKRIDDAIKKGIIIFSSTGWPRMKRFLDERKGNPLRDIWNDIYDISPQSNERLGYPTQKPEALLDRIIRASSNPGDLVLDCFAGSGTTLSVADKLDRRWIGVDCGKLAIYTIQKRLLGISSSKDLANSKNKYKKSCKPFILYNAGLYDYTMIKKLPWDQYREFALKLFQCRDEKHEISKVKLDGFLGADSVMVFNYQKHQTAVMDKHFIEDLHSILGNKIGNRFFIIAPSASVQFLEDYIQKGKTKYYILRIPYSIIEEIYNRGFSKIKQPVSELDVNNTVDAVGFDFIQVPLVECQYTLEDKMGQLGIGEGTKECVIKIDKFESKAISNKPLNFENLETLAMVMIDYDFDGEVFNLGDVFFAEDIKKLDYEIRFPMKNIKGSIMINYIDIYGNEKREIKNIADYKIVVGG